DGAHAELSDESVQILGGVGAGETVLGGGGVTEAAEVDGEHAMIGGEQRDHTVEGPPGLRESVHEQDGGAAGSGGDVVQARSVDFGDVVSDLGDGGAGRGDDGHDLSFIWTTRLSI